MKLKLNKDLILSGVILLITIVLLLVFLFTKVYTTSNTGKIIPINNHIKYINTSPKENYLEILKPTGEIPVSNSKDITIGDKVVTLRYTIESSNDFIHKINKRFDPLKLVEFCFLKTIGLVYGPNPREAPRNVHYILRSKPIDNQDKYAGARAFLKGGIQVIDTNFDFIFKIYQETTPYDFDMYYIGLIIHEMSHILTDTFCNGPYFNESRGILMENLSEYVRFTSGYYRKDKMFLLKSRKKKVTEYYGPEGAWFIYWLTTINKDILQDLHLYSRGYIKDPVYVKHTGKTQEELWKEFQKVLP